MCSPSLNVAPVNKAQGWILHVNEVCNTHFGQNTTNSHLSEASEK